MSDDRDRGLVRRIYPDLAAHGGLAAALTAMASERSIEIGEIVALSSPVRCSSAAVTSRWGEINIVADSAVRRFDIAIYGAGYRLASGGTSSLAHVFDLLVDWERGAKIEEFRTRFPFMNLEEMAGPYLRGDIIDVQWSELLQDPDYDRIRPVMQAVHADRQLGVLFPVVSHVTRLRLNLDYRDRRVGAIFITLEGGGFRVEDPFAGSVAVAQSIPEVVMLASGMLRAGDSSAGGPVSGREVPPQGRAS